ncbi:hypothetical protein D3C71_1784080 [compost metagenome]
MDARHLEVFADVLDLVDLARIAENPPFAITQNGALFPAALPQFVANLQILFGKVVPGVVFGLGFLPKILGAALQVGSDDVPAGAALGQVIESRQAPGERIRMLERQ